MLPRTLIASIFLLLTTGCYEAPDPDAERVVGARGYPCYFDTDCVEPLFCGLPDGAPFPMCTGPQPEGAPCSSALQCEWVRDERGLPLMCLQGVCAFEGVADPTGGR